MNAKELMVGNGVIFEDKEIFIPNARFIYYYSKKSEPILLTEDWVLKLKLNEMENQDVYRINYIQYHKGTDTYDYVLGYYFDENGFVANTTKEIKYVHKAQNLYFALSDNE